MIDRKYVRELFENLKTDPAKFYDKVAENVHWTVMGTHPLAGEYFRNH